MPVKTLKYSFALFILFAAFISGCSHFPQNSAPAAGKLVSSTLIAEYPVETINSTINQAFAPYGDVSDLINTSAPIKAYSIQYYTTNIDGKLIIVSGLVAFPSAANGTYPVVQYQHGTQFNNQDVPSNPTRNAEALMAMVMFAAHGYIVSAPDYIGQGVSTVKHPYLYASAMATTCADMLKAVKEFCDQNNLKTSSKLFIYGHSQGGHATMSLQRYIEQTPNAQPFTLTASGPIAGPYDITYCWNFWIQNNPPGASPIAVHSILAYKNIYGFEDTLSQLFISPYDSQVLSIDDGTHNGDEMASMLPATLQGLLQTNFLSQVADQTHPFYMEMFSNNTYINFIPKTPTRLYHGADDELVPYSLSEYVYNYMIEHGATAVQLIDVGNFGHVQSLAPAMLLEKTWFDSLK